MFSIFSREISLIKRKPTFYLVIVAILSALAFVFMLTLHFPIFPAFNFLKFDFADIPVAIAAIVLGPVAAVLVALFKCLLYLTKGIGEDLGVGTLSNFICSFVFGLTIALVFHGLNNIDRKRAEAKGAILIDGVRQDKLFGKADIALLIAIISAVILEAVVAMLSNWFLVLPVYIMVMGDFMLKFKNAAFIFGGVLPFNLIKFGAQALAAYLITKPLLRISYIKQLTSVPPDNANKNNVT